MYILSQESYVHYSEQKIHFKYVFSMILVVMCASYELTAKLVHSIIIEKCNDGIKQIGKMTHDDETREGEKLK